MYKVQSGRGHSLLEALREGQCGQNILSYREVVQNGGSERQGTVEDVWI